MQKFQGGDKLTLSLGGAGTPANSTVASTSEKLINIDPVKPTASTKQEGTSSHNRPPPPPPRTSSDPNHTMNLSKKLTNGDNKKSLADTLPVSVTHFSPSMNGFGLEKETIFTEENGINGHDNGISDTKPKNTNPFLSNSPESENDNYRSQMRKENNNYENVRLFTESEASPGNPFTSGKFNTIGRSNPFSSVKGNSTNRNNPFLDTSGSNCDTTDNTIQPNSPDASIDPTPILQPEYKNMLDSFSKPSINGKSVSYIH